LVILVHSVLAQIRLGVVVALVVLHLWARGIVETGAVLQCALAGPRIMPMQAVLLPFQRVGAVPLRLVQVAVPHAVQDVAAQILVVLCSSRGESVCSQRRGQQSSRLQTAV